MITKPRIRTASKIKPPDQGTAMLGHGASPESKIKPPDGPKLSARRPSPDTKKK